MKTNAIKLASGAVILCSILVLLVLPQLVFGEDGNSAASAIEDTACGSLVHYDTAVDTAIVESISDCSDPFSADTINEDVVTYVLGTTTIQANTTFVVPDLPRTYRFSYEQGPVNDFSYSQLYHHQGNDRVQILNEYAENGLSPNFTLQATGTYSFVHYVFEEPNLQMRHSPRWFPDWLWPNTAHAQTASQAVHVTTFEVVVAPPAPIEPAGASNVLFLPGIQGSRLHSAEDVPASEMRSYSSGERLWEPERNDDVRMLAMTSSGESVQDVYVPEIIDTVRFDRIPFISIEKDDVYASFSNFLDGLVAEDTINQWYPYAYDWRYNVSDIVKNGTLKAGGRTESLVATVEALAQTSKTGQVTIVAHSNGGLLTKVLLNELEKQGKDGLVDTIILAAVPQTGTPQALGTVLHGYEQNYAQGFVLHDTVAREIMRNFPSVYSLFPSEQYVVDASSPLITFDSSQQTKKYRDNYGLSVDTLQEYQDFLLGAEAGSDERSVGQPIYVPSTANEALLQTAIQQHRDSLQDWRAPEHVRVIELVGVGRPTPQGIRYEGLLQEECQNPMVTQACLYNTEPRPFLQFSLLGDETVMGRSAGAYRGAKELYYFDLTSLSLDRKENDKSLINHGSFVESDQLQFMVSHFLHSSTTVNNLPDFVSIDLFDFTDSYTVKQIASPVYPATIDNDGRVTGVVLIDGEWVLKEEIPSSQYFHFGEVKYLIVPSNIEHTTTLRGYKDGTYTYRYSELDATGMHQRATIYQASTTAGMVARYVTKDGERSAIAVDWEGDGQVDGTLGWNGKFMATTASSTITEVDTTPVLEKDNSVVELGVEEVIDDGSTQGTRVRPPEPQVKGMATSQASVSSTQYVELMTVLRALQQTLDQIEQQYVS